MVACGRVSTIFEAKGCTASSCHGDAMLGGLDLRSGVSFDALVRQPIEPIANLIAPRIRQQAAATEGPRTVLHGALEKAENFPLIESRRQHFVELLSAVPIIRRLEGLWTEGIGHQLGHLPIREGRTESHMRQSLATLPPLRPGESGGTETGSGISRRRLDEKPLKATRAANSSVGNTIQRHSPRQA